MADSMSAAKHTPHPWHVTPHKLGEVSAQDGATAWCYSITSKPFRATDEIEANARLISAAPELLEALIAIRDASLSGKSLSAAEAAAWHKGWAAISKATGSAS